MPVHNARGAGEEAGYDHRLVFPWHFVAVPALPGHAGGLPVLTPSALRDMPPAHTPIEPRAKEQFTGVIAQKPSSPSHPKLMGGAMNTVEHCHG